MFGDGTLGGDLGGPAGDQRRIGTGFERGAIAGQALIALGEAAAGGLALEVVDVVVVAGVGEPVQGVGQPGRGEDLGEPGVDRVEDDGFAKVDVAGVVDLVGEGVLGRVTAPVVGLGVDPVALHAAVAVAAPDQTLKDVVVAGAVRLALDRPAPGGGHQLLGAVEVLAGDQDLVDLVGGPDPVVGHVPPQLGGVAQGDVVDVEQDLVLALAVPDLVAGVAGVEQDRPDRTLGPGDTVSVPVTGPVVGGRAGHVVGGESFGDGVQAGPGQVETEDPPDDRCGSWVGFQAVQVLAVRSLAGVRVWSGVNDLVAIRRASAEEPTLGRCLGGHRGPDADLDTVPLPFAHPAVQRHHQVVGVAAGVDRSPDLGYPQLDPVVDEQREGQAELVAVERPLGLADHDGFEAAVRVA